ncbi:MBOAT family O-acyltransferase [Ruminococcus sp.]|uniref:MBOAT family O-acyltransferase n=1 Tax=Ruminococcus sp. TaxID=41978 RepID=UPI0025EE86A9|nr:MBOAT family O-acyltransferase [Ruminococcus sp.]
MQFASFTFLFLFFPMTLGIYHLTPQRWKRDVMLAISVLFLLGGGWLAALVLLLLTAATYGIGLLLEHLRTRKKLSGLVLFGTVLVYLSALILLRSNWMQSWEFSLLHGKDLFPLGLAFFVLQGIGYCTNVRRGKYYAERNWRQLFLYMLFYPRLIMGPVVPYPVALKSLCEPTFSMQQIGAGMTRFLVGLGKKLLLADNVGMLFQTVNQVDPSGYSIIAVWLGALAQLVSLYLELSGYADMAIGLALCYGVHLPESYGKSLFFPSVTKFADQWNRTVVQWFSHYVGTRFHGKNQLLHLFAVTITWGCVGLWYGFRLPTLIFGLGIGFCIWMEHLIGQSKRYVGIRYGITALLLSIGAVLLIQPDMTSACEYLNVMFGMGHFTPGEADKNLLFSYGLVLLLSVYAASGNWRTVLCLLEEKSWYRMIRIPLTVAAVLLLLCCCTAVLISTGGTVEMQLML